MVKHQEQLSAVFSALADPTRRKILERLSRRGECQVTTLAKPFRMSLPAVSRHLRILEQAQLVSRHREGRVHRIRANNGGLKRAQRWIAKYAEVWESQFDALDDLLRDQQKKDNSG